MIEKISLEKPETLEQLEAIMLQRHGVLPEITGELALELENEGRIHFTKSTSPTPNEPEEYLRTQNAFWFWTVIAISVATAVSVFAIPESAYPLVYVRSTLGIVFVLFLPGYAFIKALFPSELPIKTSSENLDSIERLALSIGMSLALVPIVGLILNYTPWGIRLAPITLSLLALTLVSATAALLREHQMRTK
jgi:hypothetical protein